jgi:hypothetical protein
LPSTQVAQSATLALYVSSLDLSSQLLSQLSTSKLVGLHFPACWQTTLQLVWAGSRLGPAADEQARAAMDAAMANEMNRIMPAAVQLTCPG